jgi:hypothetical protein
MTQTHGWVMVQEQKVLVLVRPNFKRKTVALKQRATGDDGQFLEDESRFLALPENGDVWQRLKSGKTVEL